MTNDAVHSLLLPAKDPATHILSAKNLQASFGSGGLLRSNKRDRIFAVRDISFELHSKECLVILGESGCGKTSLLRTVLRLVESSSGTLELNGDSVMQLKGKQLRAYRRQFGMVGQRVGAGLDPKIRIGDVLKNADLNGRSRALQPSTKGFGSQEFLTHLLERLSLSTDLFERYPHEISYGQRQRVVFIRALLARPDFLLLDEPVSSLDVTVKIRALALLKELIALESLAGMVFTHDLESAKYIADRVMVIYLGKVMESRTAEDFFTGPFHPYSHALLSSAGLVASDVVAKASSPHILHGEPADPRDPPSGCLFSSRCPLREPICTREEPRLMTLPEGGEVACHFRGTWPLDNTDRHISDG